MRVESVEDFSDTSGLPARLAVVRRRLASRGRSPTEVGRIVRFLGVGLVGLAVDSSLFSILYADHLSAELARAASLVVATLATWLLNRAFTFAPSGRSPHKEALRYAAVACCAQGFNYGLFLTLMNSTRAAWPLACLVLSAVLTACFSFLGQRTFAFSRGAQVASLVRE